MADMWESLGFSQSPYDARPLRAVPGDEELLVGRQEEAVQFSTTLESAEEGILVLSGPPGVGKTSFFNVQQFRLANDKAEFGPRLLAADRLCSIYPEDEARTIALRVVENLVRSMQIACTARDRKLPPETAKVSKWLNSKGSTGFEIGLQILSVGGNFGRSVSLPDVDITPARMMLAHHAPSEAASRRGRSLQGQRTPFASHCRQTTCDWSTRVH